MAFITLFFGVVSLALFFFLFCQQRCNFYGKYYISCFYDVQLQPSDSNKAAHLLVNALIDLTFQMLPVQVCSVFSINVRAAASKLSLSLTKPSVGPYSK